MIIIIGTGFSSLAASCYLSKAGYKVLVLEKNTTIGGRARQLKYEGFTFDMGPTFYWMPDVFESFFNDFNKSHSDFYTLEKLNPAYKVFFDESASVSIPDQLEKIIDVFESIEEGSGRYLKQFIAQAEKNYNLAISDLVYKPGEKITEIITPETFRKINLFFDTIKRQVRNKFKHPWLRAILEFPVLFLGATSSNTPAFYNFMNYADFGLGTWYPQGGMYSVVEAFYKLAQSLGVEFVTDAEVSSIQLNDKNLVRGVVTNKGTYSCDILLSGADYAHTETLLPESLRQYSNKYWETRSFAPSALLFYVGFDKKLDNVDHHTLFFDVDFETHANCIYKTKALPEAPLFYASFPSVTDLDVAPEGKETGIFLIPIAPDSEDTESIRTLYFEKIIQRLERLTNQSIKEHVLFSKSYGVTDFKTDYNAYKGNAYGLANTLMQTHILRPKLRSKTIKNLFFTGQLTVPGPGVPPSIISGKIVSSLIIKHYESTF